MKPYVMRGKYTAIFFSSPYLVGIVGGFSWCFVCMTCAIAYQTKIRKKERNTNEMQNHELLIKFRKEEKKRKVKYNTKCDRRHYDEISGKSLGKHFIVDVICT